MTGADPTALPATLPPIPPTTPIQGLDLVVLDLDDTLIVEEAFAHTSLEAAGRVVPALDPVRVRTAVLAEARRRWRAGPHLELCTELGFASWEGLWATFEGGHPRLDGLPAWAADYRQATWRSALGSLGVGDAEAARTCAEAFAAQQRSGHPLIDGAGRAVRRLADRYRLALLTNGPPDIQWQKVRATGLGDCFEEVVISGEIGVGKPDPAAFAHVLEALGGTPSSTLMIGDSWDRDVRGAQAAGWSTIWVSAGRARPDPEVEVPAIESVAELPSYLSSLMPARPRSCPLPPHDTTERRPLSRR